MAAGVAKCFKKLKHRHIREDNAKLPFISEMKKGLFRSGLLAVR